MPELGAGPSDQGKVTRYLGLDPERHARAAGGGGGLQIGPADLRRLVDDIPERERLLRRVGTAPREVLHLPHADGGIGCDAGDGIDGRLLARDTADVCETGLVRLPAKTRDAQRSSPDHVQGRPGDHRQDPEAIARRASRHSSGPPFAALRWLDPRSRPLRKRSHPTPAKDGVNERRPG